MTPYEIFFYGGTFFLIGVFGASMGLAPFFITMGVIVIMGIIAMFDMPTVRKWACALLSLLVIVGSLYFRVDDAKFRSSPIPFGGGIEFSGVVKSDPVIAEGAQTMQVMLRNPEVRVLITTKPYPRFSYGDEVSGMGIILAPPENGYARYLEKERIRGLMRYPSIEQGGVSSGERFQRMLYEVKHAIVQAYERILPPEEATFLSGLTIGARGTLRDELKTAMQQSGTTHLVALSGYNITILAYVVMSMLLLFSSRRVAFIIATLIIVCFVIMTGAEASVVRAAIIGFLVLVAREMGRGHSMRNIILCAGIIMVLLNPKVLVFDVGFQLSFLALLGIIYVRPALLMLFHVSEKDSTLFSWRDNFLTTLSAQLTTLPVLVINFGMFSPISLISNIVILEFIPLTMALGFLAAFTSFISYHLSFVIGLLAMIFLKIELWCIYTFARISIPIEFKMSVMYVALYFTGIVVLVWWYYRKKKYDGRII